MWSWRFGETLAGQQRRAQTRRGRAFDEISALKIFVAHSCLLGVGSGEWGIGDFFSPFPTPHSLLSFNALRDGLDILQRVFSLLNFLFGFAADVLVNFERRRQVGFDLPQAFLLGLDGAVARLVLHSYLLHQLFAVEGRGAGRLS